MSRNFKKKVKTKKLKINRIIFVLIIIIIIVFGIKMIKNKKQKQMNYSATLQENTQKGEMKFEQEKSENIKITDIKYIYFETSKKTALEIYLKNEKKDIKNQKITLKILDKNNKTIKEKKIEITYLKKGESTKVNTSLTAKIDENCKIEITEN